jgi:hypothetical protein
MKTETENTLPAHHVRRAAAVAALGLLRSTLPQ